MSKWIAEFELEDGDTMPEHMDLNYMGAKIDFHCRPMWIPCSEQLPEKNCRCLTTNEGWGLFKVDWNAWIDGQWLYPNEKPIAWMPLPEPYKAESEDEV